LGNIVIERWTRGKQRAFGLQDIDVECIDLAGRTAETHEIAEWMQTIERGRECRFSDAIVHDVTKLAAGEFLDLRDEVFVAVEDRMMTAVLLGQFSLFLGANGSDNGGAEVVRPLARNQAHS